VIKHLVLSDKTCILISDKRLSNKLSNMNKFKGRFKWAADTYEERKRNRDKQEAKLEDTFFDFDGENKGTIVGVIVFLAIFIGLALIL
jgi:hypothetical protein